MLEMIMRELEKLANEGAVSYAADEEIRLIEITLNYYKKEGNRIIEKEPLDANNYDDEYQGGDYDKEEFFNELDTEKLLDEIMKYHKTINQADIMTWSFDWFTNYSEL